MTAALTTPANDNGQNTGKDGRGRWTKEVLQFGKRDIAIPIVFLFSLSLTGLQVYPAILIILILLINRFIKNRYDFLIMITIMATSRETFFGELYDALKISDMVLAACFIAMLLVRNDATSRKIMRYTIGYFLFIFAMATFSEEAMSIQLYSMRYYMAIVYFSLVVLVFANRPFDISYFFRKLLIYFILLSAFYAIDGIILSGYFFIPNDAGAWSRSTISNITWAPFGFIFPRKMPGAYLIMIVASYPLARHYRLKWWMWAIVLAAFASTRTMTVIAGFVLSYVIFQGTFKKFMKYMLIAGVFITAMYFIDVSTGSKLRVASTFEQFVELTEARDDKDLSKFGSKRMAQIIPKYELLVDNNALFTGLGFLHPERSNNAKYQIENDYYLEALSTVESVGALTEVTQFNTVIQIGIIGLILQAIYYLAMFFAIRHRCTDYDFYLSALLAASVMGIGGFGGLNHPEGLLWIGLALGCCLLQERRQHSSSAGEKTTTPDAADDISEKTLSLHTS